MSRLLGWLCVILATCAMIWDYWRGPQQGGDLVFSSIAEGWAELHRDSLIGLNSFTEKNLSPDIWDAYILPVLNWNAALTFAILALIFLYMSRSPRAVRRKDMFSRNGRR